MRYMAGLVLTLFLIPSLGAADTLYKWVDAQGNVHYSDKPAPGATKINIPKAATFTPPAPMPVTSDAHGDRQQAAASPTVISISSPEDQATLWNTDTVTVNVSVTPSLPPGGHLTIAVDGNSQTATGTSATFKDLDRGQHTASAAVTGSRGTTLSAKPVTFFIQRGIQKKPP
ncbi:MAG TPA: DUF4124 domain-containing protein [Gammaproteobacteria bacterium]|jgi:hypothetical protein